jgi:transcriptional regulator with XRE-family HTH domain
MNSEFGPRLRRERERRKISLASIAASTKVSVALFEALERDDVSRWPNGIFRRAFIRSYAQAIGFDADDLLKEFLQRFPDPDSLRPEAAQPPPRDPVAAAAAAASLRLKLADTTPGFATGSMLAAVRGRWAAVSVDAAIVVVAGATLFALVGALWMPLGVFTLVYYWGGMLLLGSTPGVRLISAQPRPAAKKARTRRERPLLGSVSEWLATGSVGPAHVDPPFQGGGLNP